MKVSLRYVFLCITMLCVQAGTLQAQKMRQREEAFLKTAPRVGEALPDVTVYHPDGRPFTTSSLRGHYTVLTFGCLTCPPSIWNIAGLEAVQRDYGPKGVKFYFIFKSLAHPELVGGYVQPFTMDERLAQARQAMEQFGTQIPWVVDALDNRLKRALGDRPNAQFLISPDGKVLRKRHWSQPDAVRRDLEEIVGPVERITKPEDLDLPLKPALTFPAKRGVVETVQRLSYRALRMIPEDSESPFLAKLRAEGDESLISKGRGKLYLGFHLDPLHQAHWNNLTKPLSYRIESVDGVRIDAMEGSAAEISAATDCDPREFLLDVSAWPKNSKLQLTVLYYACVGDTACHAIRQRYTLVRERDADGGGARGAGPGYWDAEEFAERLLAGDEDADGRLVMSECIGLVRPHFQKLDTNNDRHLDRAELLRMASWLNHHHQPGTESAP